MVSYIGMIVGGVMGCIGIMLAASNPIFGFILFLIGLGILLFSAAEEQDKK